jgi:hypothetical protein
MELFRAYSRWKRYLKIQLAAASVDEHSAEARLNKAITDAQISNKSEKSVSAMKALAMEDPRVQRAAEKKADAYGYRKIVEALFETVDDSYFHVSREISRRSNRQAQDHREGRYGG